MTKNFGFIIPSCLHTNEHLSALDKCIDSIRTFHNNVRIVIILDHTSKINIQGRYRYNVIIEKDTPKVPADMLTYHFYHIKRYFPYAIILQDSMYLKKPFDIEGVKNIQYLWHFTNHRVHWTTINEPKTQSNVDKGIVTHDDLIKHCFTTFKEQGFIDYCKEYNENKNRWSGCFGCLSIISNDFLDILEWKTGITEIMMNMKTYRMRKAMESIFALACQYTMGKEIHESYGGLFCDGISYTCNMKSHIWEKVSYGRTNIQENKNIVLITSICQPSDNPFTYINIRSIFTQEERFEQLKQTITSARNKIPNAYVFLVEYSDFSSEELEYLHANCDYVYNLKGEMLDEEVHSQYKALGERIMTLKAMDYIYQNYIVENIFKISGRYMYSENFDYSSYNNDKMNFYPIYGNRNNICTCGYKINTKYLGKYIQYLSTTRQNAINVYSGSNEQYIAAFVSQNSNDITFLEKLGIEGKVSVSGDYIDI